MSSDSSNFYHSQQLRLKDETTSDVWYHFVSGLRASVLCLITTLPPCNSEVRFTIHCSFSYKTVVSLQMFKILETVTTQTQRVIHTFTITYRRTLCKQRYNGVSRHLRFIQL